MTNQALSGLLAYRRVLVVEDEFYTADDIAQMLQRCGALLIGPASTREQALALVAAEPVDAAILDINLRGEMSFEVAAALRERERLPSLLRVRSRMILFREGFYLKSARLGY